jgi:hypothetical protein
MDGKPLRRQLLKRAIPVHLELARCGVADYSHRHTTCAARKAGLSLMPSPTIAITAPPFWSARTILNF